MADPLRGTNLAGALRSWVSSRRSALLISLIGLLAFGLSVYLCAPGYLATDSGGQLEQARSFAFTDDHPLLMALIWRYTDRLLPGPLGMLVLMNAMYWGGLTGLFSALPGPLPVRALGLLAVGFFPPLFSAMPVVMKDGFMHGALLAGLACILIPGRAYRVRLAAAAVLFLAAVGARHNAIGAVWPFLMLPLLRLPVLLRRPRWLRLLLAAAISIVLTLGAGLALQRSLAPLAQQKHFWQKVALFDLAGMSLRAGEVLVPRKARILTRGMGLDEIRQVFSIDWGPRLYYCIPVAQNRCVPVFRVTSDPDQLQRISAGWRAAVLKHPGAYLAHRVDFARQVLSMPPQRLIYYFSSEGLKHPVAEGYPLPRSARAILSFIDGQAHAFYFLPGLYALACVILLPLSLVRYLLGGSVVPLLFALSGLTYQLSVIVGAISPDFRYSVWMMLSTVLGIVVLLADWLARARSHAEIGSRSASGRAEPAAAEGDGRLQPVT